MLQLFPQKQAHTQSCFLSKTSPSQKKQGTLFGTSISAFQDCYASLATSHRCRCDLLQLSTLETWGNKKTVDTRWQHIFFVGWWFHPYFLNFHPRSLAKWLQFDYRIFFKWMVQPPTRFVWWNCLEWFLWVRRMNGSVFGWRIQRFKQQTNRTECGVDVFFSESLCCWIPKSWSNIIYIY